MRDRMAWRISLLHRVRRLISTYNAGRISPDTYDRIIARIGAEVDASERQNQ